MHALRRMATVLGIGLAAGACGKGQDATPSDVAMQFYVTMELSGVRDLPDARALPAMAPYLTASLVAQLERARAVRDSAATASPTDKPPFVDANPFSSLFEGYTTYAVRETRLASDTAFVTMSLTNSTLKPVVAWTDTLVLVKAGPRDAVAKTSGAPWRIADLRYGGGWEFGFRGTLSTVLPTAP